MQNHKKLSHDKLWASELLKAVLIEEKKKRPSERSFSTIVKGFVNCSYSELISYCPLLLYIYIIIPDDTELTSLSEIDT